MTAPLITSLEQAGEGSRALDATLWYALFEPDVERVAIATEEYHGKGREAAHCELGSKWADECKPPIGHFTTSLDAALALAERVLGDEWAINLQRMAHWNGGPTWKANVTNGLGTFEEWLTPTPALALCIAILRATHQETT